MPTNPILGRLCGRSRRNCCCSFISGGLSGGMGGGGGFQGGWGASLRKASGKKPWHCSITICGTNQHRFSTNCRPLVIQLNNAYLIFGCISRWAWNCFASLQSVYFRKLLQIQNWQWHCSRIDASPRAWLAGSEQPRRLQDKNNQIVWSIECFLKLRY